MPIFTAENEAIRKAIDTHHLKSPKLMPICSALASVPDPRSLALLEKIQATHPDTNKLRETEIIKNLLTPRPNERQRGEGHG